METQEEFNSQMRKVLDLFMVGFCELSKELGWNPQRSLD